MLRDGTQGGAQAGPPEGDEAARLRQRLELAELITRVAQEEKERLATQLKAAETAAQEAGAELEALRQEAQQREAAAKEAAQAREQAAASVQRARADMEQLRRRAQREKEEMRQQAEAKLVQAIFPVLDNFELAVDNLNQNSDYETLAKGVRMIHRDLSSTLASAGVQQILPYGEPFNPQLHEAASTTHREGAADNTIVEVLRPGYSLRGRVLRPAFVIVNATQHGQAQPPQGAESPRETASQQEGREPPDSSPEAPPSSPLDHAWGFLETRFDD